MENEEAIAFPDESDFVWEYEIALSQTGKEDVGNWIEQWPDKHSRASMVNSLLRCGCEIKGYDLAWVSGQFSDPRLSLSPQDRLEILREIFVDQVEGRVVPRWKEYESFGFSASQLALRCEVDRCYLGQTFEDRHQLTSRIASGGLGTVYQSCHLASGKQHAIKVPRTWDADSSDIYAEKLRGEASVLQAVSFPGVPRFVELLEAPDGPVLVMQLIEGAPLQSLIPTDGLPADEALLLVNKVASVADNLHRQGYVHGDIKAENVLVDDQGKVTLIDFNVSRHDDPLKAIEGFPGGTLPSMSPEAIIGVAAEVDLRQDVYALGSLLYSCLTGQELFTSTSREEAVVSAILLLQNSNEPDFPEETPEKVRQICLAAISRQPVSRFETAGDFSEACRAVLAGKDKDLEIPPPRTRLSAWRLGSFLGLLLVRQRRLSTTFSEAEEIEPDAKLPQHLCLAIGNAIGVTTAMDEVLILAEQLGLKVEKWKGYDTYSTAFYRANKLQGKDLSSLQATIEEAEAWCCETLSSLESSFAEQKPLSAPFFLAAVQSHFAPYSKTAATRWLACAALLPLPSRVTDEYSDACSTQSKSIDWQQAREQLEYKVVKWLRWGDESNNKD